MHYEVYKTRQYNFSIIPYWKYLGVNRQGLPSAVDQRAMEQPVLTVRSPNPRLRFGFFTPMLLKHDAKRDQVVKDRRTLPENDDEFRNSGLTTGNMSLKWRSRM